MNTVTTHFALVGKNHATLEVVQLGPEKYQMIISKNIDSVYHQRLYPWEFSRISLGLQTSDETEKRVAYMKGCIDEFDRFVSSTS